MIRLDFEYSRENDVQRIRSTIERFDSISVPKLIPDILLSDGKPKAKISDDEIADVVSSEYNEEFYVDAKKALASEWTKREKKFFEVIEKVFSDVQMRYLVWITKYGTGGSYYPGKGNMVQVNVDSTYPARLPTWEITAHEIIELSLHPRVNIYSRQLDPIKERLVDHILKFIFPDDKKLSPISSDPIKAFLERSADRGFEFFPDIKQVVTESYLMPTA